MRVLPIALAMILTVGGTAAAQEVQSARLSRGDVHVVVGWQNLKPGDAPPSRWNDRWVNTIVWSSAGAGWYWTDNLKTQVDLGGGTEGTQLRFSPITVDGRQVNLTLRLGVRHQTVAVSQQYQFYRNRWVHPFVGAGVALARETRIERYDAIIVYDNVTKITQTIPARVESPYHEMVVRPFGTLGFKAYLSPRAFFTLDTRVTVRQGVDEVLFRFGFGTDF
jgi:hypothetical protein